MCPARLSRQEPPCALSVSSRSPNLLSLLSGVAAGGRRFFQIGGLGPPLATVWLLTRTHPGDEHGFFDRQAIGSLLKHYGIFGFNDRIGDFLPTMGGKT